MVEKHIDNLEELKKDFPLMSSLIKGFHSEDSLSEEERRMFFAFRSKYNLGELIESMVAFPDSFDNKIILKQADNIPEAAWNWYYDRRDMEIDIPLKIFLGVYFCLNIAGHSSEISFVSELIGINQLGSNDEENREMIKEKFPMFKEINFPRNNQSVDEWIAECEKKHGKTIKIRLLYKKIK